MKRGFTLIELLITVAILAILAVVGGVNLFGYYHRQNLELTVEEIVAFIRDVQNRSFTQQESSQWSIRFENATEDSVSIFYATTTLANTYVLRTGVQFTDPTEGNYKDIVFLKLTGYPNVSSSVSVALVSNPSISATISVSALGRVSHSEL